MRLAVVPSLNIPDVWMKALPHLLKGRTHWDKFYTLNQLRNNLNQGQQQLWILIEESDVLGVVLTQIDSFPERRILRINYLGGTGFKRKMISCMEAIEEWGREKDCDSVDILGRDEWFPLVKNRGYESPGRVYRKELK